MRIQILPGKIELAEIRNNWIVVVVYRLKAGAVIWVNRSNPRQLQIRVQPVQDLVLLSGGHDGRRATRDRVKIVKDVGIVKHGDGWPKSVIVW